MQFIKNKICITISCRRKYVKSYLQKRLFSKWNHLFFYIGTTDKEAKNNVFDKCFSWSKNKRILWNHFHSSKELKLNSTSKQIESLEKNSTKKQGWYHYSRNQIRGLLLFLEKALLSSLLIYIFNVYIIDITLTTGSSMHPLIHKDGVILFYVCDELLHLYHKVYMFYVNTCITLLTTWTWIQNDQTKKKQLIDKISELEKRKKKKKIYYRGDVILLYAPLNMKKRVCKRIIAIEKDKIYSGKGNVFIIEVPKQSVWIEGDNKNDSLDSRSYGCVHTNLIIGKVFLMMNPLSQFQFISRKNYKIKTNQFEYLADEQNEKQC